METIGFSLWIVPERRKLPTSLQLYDGGKKQEKMAAVFFFFRVDLRGSGKSANLKITICFIVFFWFQISSFHSSAIGYVLRPYCIPCLFSSSLFLFSSFLFLCAHFLLFPGIAHLKRQKKRIASGIRATIDQQPPWVANRRQPAPRHRY